MPEVPNLPAVAGQPLSVILLAYNDASHLEEVVDAWIKQVEGLGRTYEILVVDDGSTDGTAALADSLAARHSFLLATRHEKPSGVGAALRTGIALAKNPLLVYTTADLQYQPSDLHAFLAEIDKVHIVPGFRRYQKVPLLVRVLGGLYRIVARLMFDLGPTPPPGWLGWREHLSRYAVRALFGLRTQDLNCLFMLCRREVFAHLPIQSEGPFVHTEILAKANFLGCVIAEEIPVIYRPYQGDRRPSQWRSDAYLVFSNPDFSATLPDAAMTSAEKTTACL